MMSPSSPRRAALLCIALAALAVSACSKGDGGIAPAKPASVAAVSSSVPTATVGSALATPPTFVVSDASGNPLGGVSVSVVVSGGGGSLVGAPTKTASGPTTVGTWTLGTTAGTNTLTVTISGLAPLSITATGTPGAAAKIVVSAGAGQTGLAGAQLATALSAAVQDQFGNGIQGAPVTFQSTAGGGSITPSLVTTNANGLASGAVWQLGNKGGTQSATATSGSFAVAFSATIQSSFPLDLRFFGPAMPAEAQLAFTNAANRIRAAIISPLSSVQANVNLADCQFPGLTGTFNETTTGVIIYASVRPIDGVGKVLAQAGPCWVRGSNSLPLIGAMEFDDADIQTYINTGRFEAVVLHEMNHVVGFGTIWSDRGLLANPAFDDNGAATGSTNPRFTGATALANCLSLGGTLSHCTSGAGVAVELCGGPGTADGHWRELLTTNCTGANNGPVGGAPAFDTELMTGYAESTPNMPWSTVTIGSFQDLGYSVNQLAADAYTVPSLLAMARMALQDAAATDGPREVVRLPRFAVSPGGAITTITRAKR